MFWINALCYHQGSGLGLTSLSHFTCQWSWCFGYICSLSIGRLLFSSQICCMLLKLTTKDLKFDFSIFSNDDSMVASHIQLDSLCRRGISGAVNPPRAPSLLFYLYNNEDFSLYFDFSIVRELCWQHIIILIIIIPIMKCKYIVI